METNIPKSLISGSTLIPLGIVALLILSLVGGVMYIQAMASDVTYCKQQIAEHKASDDARVQALDVRVQASEKKGAVTDEKLDTIMTKLDAISKKLNVL
ncbi:MAG: hypothetical protein PHC53_05405 [Patescibacteria group bacterium]|nr:hypothetical protein [Patescibacteria group bacterium]